MSNGMGDFLDKIYNYLVKKFPDAPLTTIDEAAGYIVSRTMVEISDAIQERDRMYRELITGAPKKMTRPVRKRDSGGSQGVSQGEFDKSWGE